MAGFDVYMGWDELFGMGGIGNGIGEWDLGGRGHGDPSTVIGNSTN